MSADRSPVNALHWIGGAAALAATVWWWNGFSGPFRWLIDLQVALTGRYYWEPLAVALLLGGLLVPVVVVAALLDPVVPRFKARTWGWLALVAALLATAAAAHWAWRLWTAPEGPTRQTPPVRTLDLDRLDLPHVQPGPVRLIGRADRRLLVRLRREPRGSRIYLPLSGLHRAARDMPVPVVAHCYSRYGRDCISPALEGWIYPGAYDNREAYRLRRAGVLRTPHFFMLVPGLPTYDSYVEISEQDRSKAIDIALCFGFFWFVVGLTWILAPPSRFPARPAPPAPASDAPPASEGRNPNPYLLPLFVAAFAFVFLSVLGVAAFVIHVVSDAIP